MYDLAVCEDSVFPESVNAQEIILISKESDVLQDVLANMSYVRLLTIGKVCVEGIRKEITVHRKCSEVYR